MRKYHRNKKGKEGITPFGSDAHKDVMYKLELISPAQHIDAWNDYFARKPPICVIDCPIPEKKSKKSVSIHLLYHGHEENFPPLMEEMEELSQVCDSDLRITHYAPAVVKVDSVMTTKKGHIKGLVISDPFVPYKKKD